MEAYIKSNFAEVYNNLANKTIGCGSVSDGKYKVEVHIINFDEEDYARLEIKKGDKVQIIGSVRNKSKYSFISVYIRIFLLFYTYFTSFRRFIRLDHLFDFAFVFFIFNIRNINFIDVAIVINTQDFRNIIELSRVLL